MFDTLSRLPVVGFSAAQEHERLRVLCGEARALLAEGERAYERDADVSGWSPAQHLHHTAAIDRDVLQMLRRWCETPPEEEEATGDRLGSAPNAAGYVVLLSGRIPRGRGRSPDAFVPPNRPERRSLDASIRENEDALEATFPHLNRLPTLPRRAKHPRLGVLDARSWLRFAHVHARHHHRIVREIISS